MVGRAALTGVAQGAVLSLKEVPKRSCFVCEKRAAAGGGSAGSD